jgi:hypothetical protein
MRMWENVGECEMMIREMGSIRVWDDDNEMGAIRMWDDDNEMRAIRMGDYDKGNGCNQNVRWW